MPMMIRNATYDEQVAFLPTPQQIAEVCARIRETWSPREERKRREWSIAGPVMVPVVETLGVVVE